MVKPFNKRKHITIKQPFWIISLLYQIMIIVCLIVIEIDSLNHF
jgi:hypothetical protein